MWASIARFILTNRLWLLITLAVATAFMGYQASKIQLSYDFVRVLPATDPAFIDYENFKQKFGEDGNVMIIGFQEKDLFQLDKFNGWYDLSNEIKEIEGIQDVLSIASLFNIQRNDSLSKFDFKPIIASRPKSQAELDSLKDIITSLPFYEGLAYNKETNATIMAITFDKKNLNSKNRLAIVKEIKEKSKTFAKANNIEMHYSGMPYIRTEFMNKVGSEMKLFLLLAVLVTAFILYAFFQSIPAVLFSLVVVLIGVVWALGTIDLFNYKITILSGLIPPLIIIIGIPNCIFLINKYHSELSRHGNKVKALSRMIQTIGLSLFLANITTAIGFGVFYFTNSSLLVEFGVVAAINVMVTYIITLIFIPIILSFLPAPALKHTKHIDAKRVNKVLDFIDHLVHHRRKAIYITITVLVVVCLYGMTKINVIGYVVDDLPKKDPIYTDLRFFEEHFKGVLPFEVAIDTKKGGGVFADNANTLYKIKAFQKLMSEYPEFSKPLSIVEALKFSYQAYKGGHPKYYILPGSLELKKLADYTSTINGNENSLKPFLDSTKRFTRVSYQMADVGSVKIKQFVSEIQPKVDSIFDPKEYNVTLTGHSLVFLKSNDYLLKNLLESLLIEIILISIVGLALFRSFRIIMLSKLPCLIPLIITAGIMGFFNINFKPSTILIYTIAFGIASDGTIYFLAKYRHELKNQNRTISEAVSITIKEIGLSMIYTAIILFCGFGIFAASSFGGTVALGILISITLLVSMCTNLVLLPAILLSLGNAIPKKEIIEEPLIDIDEEFDVPQLGQ